MAATSPASMGGGGAATMGGGTATAAMGGGTAETSAAMGGGTAVTSAATGGGSAATPSAIGGGGMAAAGEERLEKLGRDAGALEVGVRGGVAGASAFFTSELGGGPAGGLMCFASAAGGGVEGGLIFLATDLGTFLPLEESFFEGGGPEGGLIAEGLGEPPAFLAAGVAEALLLLPRPEGVRMRFFSGSNTCSTLLSLFLTFAGDSDLLVESDLRSLGLAAPLRERRGLEALSEVSSSS